MVGVGNRKISCRYVSTKSTIPKLSNVPKEDKMKKTYSAVLVIVMFSVLLSACGATLPAECRTNGGIKVTLRDGDYFLLDGIGWDWTGVSFQHHGEYSNIPLNVGESFSTGLTNNEDGSSYYKWTIFRCGSSDFSVWETKNLLPEPTPMPTRTPVVVIP